MSRLTKYSLKVALPMLFVTQLSLIPQAQTVQALALQGGNSDAPYTYSFDLNKIVPGMPESSSLGSYGNVNVNTAKGIPNISFNIYTISKKSISVPVTISYDAGGIRYSDIPSCVGMKWFLNAGGTINRSVNGMADEKYLLSNLNILSQHFQDSLWAKWGYRSTDNYLEKFKNQQADCNLDHYFYTLPDRSGSMLLYKDAKFYADADYSKIKIDYSYTNTGQIINSSLDEFTIRDEKGNTYIFGTYFDENTALYNKLYTKGAYLITSRVSWKLRKIITLNRETINFEYFPYSYKYTTISSDTYISYRDAIPNEDNACPSPRGSEYSVQSADFTNTASLLSRIYTDDEEVNFIYEDNNSLPIWKRNLREINVKHRPSAKVIKKVLFEHQGNNLVSFTESDAEGVTPKKHYFSYFPTEDDFGPMSLNRDIYGYSNGSRNSQWLWGWQQGAPSPLPFRLANRAINGNYAKQGTLHSITYPTGGSSVFEYEANADGGSFAPGIRIRSQEDRDIDNLAYNKKNYYYTNLVQGWTMFDLYTIRLGRASEEGVSFIKYRCISDPPAGLGSNFYYREVFVENGVGAKKSCSKFFYRDQQTMYDKKPMLVKENLYTDDTFHLSLSTEMAYRTIDVDSCSILNYESVAPIVYTGARWAWVGEPVTWQTDCRATINNQMEEYDELKPHISQMIEKKVTSFNKNGGQLESKSILTYFPYPDLVKSVESMDSKSESNKVEYTYPFNHLEIPVFKMMYDSSVLTPLVTQQRWIKGVNVFEKRNSYEFSPFGFFNLKNQTITNNISNTKQEYNYLSYDVENLEKVTI